MSREQIQEIERVTYEALSSAEAGLWDHVAELYQQRESMMPFKGIHPSVANKLIKADRAVQEKAKLVQRAILQSIENVHEHHRKIQRCKNQWGQASGLGSRFLHTV